MKYLLIIALVIIVSLTSATGPADVVDSVLERMEETPSATEVEVVEIFRAMDVEELEAALTNGYPMPWLDEILNDETIPEEDRYWLDCRVRAVIAQDLHLFFDREGNPVHVEADWIAPGEDYWRENFIVNLVGESYRFDDLTEPTGMIGEPGNLIDNSGNKIGEVALAYRRLRLARNASVAVHPTGTTQIANSRIPKYACFLYPDGSFREVPIDDVSGNWHALSDDGSRAVFTCHTAQQSDLDNMMWVFNRSGDLEYKVDLPTLRMMGSNPPAVSPDGSFIACPLNPDFSNHDDQGGVLLLDGDTGEELLFIDYLMGHTLRFTPDGRYLCIGGLSGAAIVDTETIEIIWSEGIQNRSELQEKFFHTNSSNNFRIIGVCTRIRTGDVHYPEEWGFAIFNCKCDRIYQEQLHVYPDISPSGRFVFCQAYSIVGSNSWNDYLSVPMVVFRVEGGE